MNKLILIFSFVTMLFSLYVFNSIREVRSIETVPFNHKMHESVPADNPKYSAIVTLRDKEGDFFCTGFVIDPHFIATAAHCLNDKLGKDIHIFTDRGTSTSVTGMGVGVNNRMDYGVIGGNFEEFRVAPVDMINFKMAGKLFLACGNPFGQKVPLCIPVTPINNYGFQIRAVGILFPGMSGGPVVDPETGEVVGLNSAVGNGEVYLVPMTGFAASFGID